MKLANAFSISMLCWPYGSLAPAVACFTRVSLREVSERARREGIESYVGHADTARLLSNLLGVEVPVNRASLALNATDELVVAQYRGPRLPEGATELPAGATIEFYQVRVGGRFDWRAGAAVGATSSGGQ
jgi:hypothetical protein